MTDLINLVKCFQDAYVVEYVSTQIPFLLSNNISLNRYTTFYLSIHCLIDIYE